MVHVSGDVGLADYRPQHVSPARESLVLGFRRSQGPCLRSGTTISAPSASARFARQALDRGFVTLGFRLGCPAGLDEGVERSVERVAGVWRGVPSTGDVSSLRTQTFCQRVADVLEYRVVVTGDHELGKRPDASSPTGSSTSHGRLRAARTARTP